MREGMNVYLAGRVSRREELRGYAAILESLGLFVTSSWLPGKPGLAKGHANRSEMTRRDRAEHAKWDLDDIRKADILVLFTEKPGHGSAGNGRLVEFGYALGRHKECWVVGPLENLFTCLPTVQHFEYWENLHGWLIQERFPSTLRDTHQGESAGGNAAASGAL